MAVFTSTLKTHGRTELTSQFPNLNPCIFHQCQPTILDIVAGRRKEHHYVAICVEESCGKISTESAQHVVDAWNKWNPAT